MPRHIAKAACLAEAVGARLIISRVVSASLHALARRRMAALVWAAAHAITPETVGGCRTQELIPYAEAAGLQVVSRDVVCAGGRLRDPLSLLCSEVLIARKPLE